MKIAVCDDDTRQIDQIKGFLEEYRGQIPNLRISAFTSGEALLTAYQNGKRYDILFLDIIMEGINGLETAEGIRKYDADAILIFISHFPQGVFRAFSLNAFQYMVKPIHKERFDDEMRRALKVIQFRRQKYILKNKREICILDISNITYIEGYHRHIKINTVCDPVHEAVGQMNAEEAKLKGYGFVRVHQGYL